MLRTFCMFTVMVTKLSLHVSESLLIVSHGCVNGIEVLRELTHDSLICICLLTERWHILQSALNLRIILLLLFAFVWLVVILINREWSWGLPLFLLHRILLPWHLGYWSCGFFLDAAIFAWRIGRSRRILFFLNYGLSFFNYFERFFSWFSVQQIIYQRLLYILLVSQVLNGSFELVKVVSHGKQIVQVEWKFSFGFLTYVLGLKLVVHMGVGFIRMLHNAPALLFYLQIKIKFLL